MTLRIRTRSPTLRGWAAGVVLAALATQMALPATHGFAIRHLGQVAEAALAAGETAELRLSSQTCHAAPHDPAVCPVCQSLMRAGSVALPPASFADPVAEVAAPPGTLPVHVGGRLLRDGHPPRAPPAFLLA